MRRADSLDWKGIPASEISKRVLTRVRPGSIVLFHNAGEHTPEALPEILKTLLEQGYKIVPISALLLKGTYNVDYTIDHTGRQIAKTGTESTEKNAEKKEPGKNTETQTPEPATTEKNAQTKAAESKTTEKTTDTGEVKAEQPSLQKPAASKKK